MLTHAETARPEVLSALSARRIGLIVAVLPGPRADLMRLGRRAAEAGISVAYWPMLANDEGRWASLSNAGLFVDYVRVLVDELTQEGLVPEELLFDMEPPIDRMQSVLAGHLLLRRASPREADAARGSHDLLSFFKELSARGIGVSAAVMPFLMFDKAGLGGFEWALGVPLTGVDWAHASVMMYSTMVEGYSRGFLHRADVRPLLASCARVARERLGNSAGISLGVVGVGALGDEATYRSVDELRDDVAITRAAGMDDLTLFDLGGVLSRPPFEAWLDAFVETEAAASLPSWTGKSFVVGGLGLTVSRVLGGLEKLTRRL